MIYTNSTWANPMLEEGERKVSNQVQWRLHISYYFSPELRIVSNTSNAAGASGGHATSCTVDAVRNKQLAARSMDCPDCYGVILSFISIPLHPRARHMRFCHRRVIGRNVMVTPYTQWNRRRWTLAIPLTILDIPSFRPNPSLSLKRNPTALSIRYSTSHRS